MRRRLDFVCHPPRAAERAEFSNTCWKVSPLVVIEAKLPSRSEVRVKTNRHVDEASNQREKNFQILIDGMDLVITSCESALLSSDLGTILFRLKYAKTHYAAALLRAWKFRLSVHDIHTLELKSARLETIISKLEVRCQKVAKSAD